jgi:hypothetical protein
MKSVQIRVALTNGQVATVTCPVNELDVGRLEGSGGATFAREFAQRVLAEIAEDPGSSLPRNLYCAAVHVVGIMDRDAIGTSVTITTRRSSRTQVVGVMSSTRPSRAVRRCNSLLDAAGRLLPPSVRDEAVDEWRDEIETAAEGGRPVVRRTLSMLRSLPIHAWRARRPVRARPGDR